MVEALERTIREGSPVAVSHLSPLRFELNDALHIRQATVVLFQGKVGFRSTEVGQMIVIYQGKNEEL